jgi:hypothetical protein
MTISRRMRLLGALTLLGAALLAGRSFLLKDWTMNETISLPPTYTVCVGRFLLDLPVSLELAGDVELYYGLDKNFRTVKVEVLRQSGATPTFEALVKKRQVELMSVKYPEAPSGNMLALSKSVGEKTMLIRAHDSSQLPGYFKSEIYREIGGAVVVFSGDVFKKDKPEDIEAKVLRVAERSQFLDLATTAPPMPGTCIGNVVINAGQDREDFTMMGGGSDQWPDVSMRFSSNSISNGSDGGLFKRLADKASMLDALGAHTDELRRSRPTFGGMPAQEILEKGIDHGKIFRSFTIESMPPKADFGSPSMQLNMSMGGQVDYEYRDATWSDREATMIWDAIIKSVRLRPGAL